ncbi:hypothetical protein JQX09_24420 [Sulfitobacter pseudonitzschiae]|uniref:Uncharacterized protein n=1 Tax=Pseudosulfitobacter pseudonitzschiae TaxID=1402135 RepID=A0A9Q2RZU2_9RHOB|nr:hypothetical protein [Pseudosulfitobacter pseudonitzschiae]MBM2295119.1 hypothetical protein [Pseudosulfitobacter pseudonitzschiae]MBM2300023.1 hypothetical protein [Pseudosulfitobacter pseudonitzschiae]MBM2304952.1 hypothetical protein [Pseudosulfitobacter pseudonitzschiae]MBM2314730.1 hypothetical protein [Pseudosulfitobacter pseudonitzschiae]MBM2319587.1 hypothetical protein [Pseudosulfitobacter pseudonitzschiae]
MNTSFQNLTDMFDGGGAGASGGAFKGGGLLSQLGNSMRNEAAYQQQWGEQQRDQDLHRIFGPMSGYGQPSPGASMYGAQRPRLGEYNNFADMFDGGGVGRSGDTFQGGGLLSILGNLTGTKPWGKN